MTCSTANGTITGNSNCQGLQSSATSSASYTVSGNALDLNAAIVAETGSGYIGDSFFNESAAASNSEDLTFTTAGNPRPGFVEVNNVSYSFVGFGGGSDNVQYSLTSQSSTVAQLSCVTNKTETEGPNCPLYNLLYTNPTFVPITLGTTFELAESETSHAQASNDPSGSTGAAGVDVIFQFFESDGKTPAALVVPEPEAFALVMVGMFGLASARLRSHILHKKLVDV